MASESPAAHAARVKVQHPGWQIWRGETTGEWWASPPAGCPDQELISAPDVPALEAKIIDAESRRSLS
jgi:hypothetical protein